MADPRKPPFFNLNAITKALWGKITSFKTGSISFLNHISTKVSNIKNYFYKPKVSDLNASATQRAEQLVAIEKGLADQTTIKKQLADLPQIRADEESGAAIEERALELANAELTKECALLLTENRKLRAKLEEALKIASDATADHMTTLPSDADNQTTTITVNRLTDKAAELAEALEKKQALLHTYEKSFAVCRVQLFRLNEITVKHFEATAILDATLAKLMMAEINGLHDITQLREKIYATNKTIQTLEKHALDSGSSRSANAVISLKAVSKAEGSYIEIKKCETLVKVYLDELRNAYIAQDARTVSIQKVMSERLAETQKSTLSINKDSLILYKELTKILASNEELAQLKQLPPPRAQRDLEQQFKRLLDEVLRPTESEDHYGRPKSPDELKPHSTTKSTLHSEAAKRYNSEASPLTPLRSNAPYQFLVPNLSNTRKNWASLSNAGLTIQKHNIPSTNTKVNPPIPPVPNKDQIPMFPEIVD